MTNEEAITTISYLRSEYNCFDEGRERYHALSMAIEALKNQWIPCEERLPEWGATVLSQLQDGEMIVNWIIDDEDNEWFHDRVVAWMPLPKPYEGRTE